jgi:hypothetical protein
LTRLSAQFHLQRLVGWTYSGGGNGQRRQELYGEFSVHCSSCSLAVPLSLTVLPTMLSLTRIRYRHPLQEGPSGEIPHGWGPPAVLPRNADHLHPILHSCLHRASKRTKFGSVTTPEISDRAGDRNRILGKTARFRKAVHNVSYQLSF